jgi:spore maturation protein CgeB
MKLAVFGLSITSSWGNGHATVYRGLLKALSRQGVDATFIEKDLPWYAENRDLPDAPFASVRLYREHDQFVQLVDWARASADVILVGSYFPDGIELIDRLALLPGPVLLYYDIDTPVTLSAFRSKGGTEYIRAGQLPAFEAVLSFTGGTALEELESKWAARRAVTLYCGLDPETHRPADPQELFMCRLGYMGTYSEDRHAAWERLFLLPATRLPAERFVLAGPQYPDVQLPGNVLHIQHLPPPAHAAFYSSCDLSLNITRAPMVEYGHSPSVRLFEAAGCGACVISDRWIGLEEVFSIGEEVLVAGGEDDMVAMLARIDRDRAREIGDAMRRRALREHTYDVRAKQLLDLIEAL